MSDIRRMQVLHDHHMRDNRLLAIKGPKAVRITVRNTMTSSSIPPRPIYRVGGTPGTRLLGRDRSR
jgi:hypothetical protein